MVKNITSKELLLRSLEVNDHMLYEGSGVTHGDQGGHKVIPWGSQVSNSIWEPKGVSG